MMVEVGDGDILPTIMTKHKRRVRGDYVEPFKKLSLNLGASIRPCQLINKDRTGDSLGEKIFIKENLLIIYYMILSINL